MPAFIQEQSMKINDIYNAFIHKPESIVIKDKRYPTTIETNFVREKLQQNLTELPCLDISMEPFGWGIIIVEEDEYREYRVNEWNEEARRKALAAAILAEPDEEAKTAMTYESQAVKVILATKVITDDSADAQLPTFPRLNSFAR